MNQKVKNKKRKSFKNKYIMAMDGKKENHFIIKCLKHLPENIMNKHDTI